MPTTVAIGGTHARRIEAQATRVSITTAGSRGPVVAVAASIVERTIVVVAREQKVWNTVINGTSIVVKVFASSRAIIKVITF